MQLICIILFSSYSLNLYPIKIYFIFKNIPGHFKPSEQLHSTCSLRAGEQKQAWPNKWQLAGQCGRLLIEKHLYFLTILSTCLLWEEVLALPFEREVFWLSDI